MRYGRRNARDEDEILRELQLSRRDAPPDGLADHLLCVVCLDQTREVIVMPCGHVCLCQSRLFLYLYFIKIRSQTKGSGV